MTDRSPVPRRSGLGQRAGAGRVVLHLLHLMRLPAYSLTLIRVFLEHQVPPHPWKAGLADAATVGLVCVLELLFVETTHSRSEGPDALRLPRSLVGATVVIVVVALSLAAALGISASGMN